MSPENDTAFPWDGRQSENRTIRKLIVPAIIDLLSGSEIRYAIMQRRMRGPNNGLLTADQICERARRRAAAEKAVRDDS